MPYWSSGDMTNQKINTKLGDLLGWVGGKVENEGQRETNFQPNYGPKWNWVIFYFPPQIFIPSKYKVIFIPTK